MTGSAASSPSSSPFLAACRMNHTGVWAWGSPRQAAKKGELEGELEGEFEREPVTPSLRQRGRRGG